MTIPMRATPLYDMRDPPKSLWHLSRDYEAGYRFFRQRYAPTDALDRARHILIRRDAQGKLYCERYAWPGMYPLFYVDGHNNVLCPDCAFRSLSDDIDEKNRATDCDANWEDPSLYCDDCSKRIESAYAEDVADGNDAPEGAEGDTNA